MTATKAASRRTGAVNVKVLSTVGVQGVLEEMAPEFEAATGHKLSIEFNVATFFKRRIEDGETFDLGIFTSAVTDELIKEGKIDAGTRADIARSGIGFAVRAGSAKPDISTVAAFTRTLLAADSVVYPKEGISGIYFADVLARLGIAEQMKPRTLLDTSGGLVGNVVAKGHAEYAVQLVSELMPVRGIDVVGPIPAELQRYVVLTGGTSAGAQHVEEAMALLNFLRAPAARPVIQAKGLEAL